MVDQLIAGGGIVRDSTAGAMRSVPREHFLHPGASVEEAYSNSPLLLKRDRRGGVISTISQPSMIAAMLDQLAVKLDDRILEIGTASGYNAALLATLAGPKGRVTSMELEPDLAAAARRSLESLGFDSVEVLCADGRRGWAAGAPYDAIVVTAAAERIEPDWVEQLSDGGRLVVPIASSGMCFGYLKQGSELVEQSKVPAAFVPLRRPPAAPK